MIDLLTYVFWVALGILVALPLGVYGWRIGCAMGGWRCGYSVFKERE